MLALHVHAIHYCHVSLSVIHLLLLIQIKCLGASQPCCSERPRVALLDWSVHLECTAMQRMQCYVQLEFL